MNTYNFNIKHYRDWDQEGHIVVEDPQTLDLYRQMKYDFQPVMKDCFFAFGEDQFKEAVRINRMEGKKILSAGAGLYGTKAGLDDLFEQYKSPEKKIIRECNPQEVYFFEYNNHECMFTDDTEAVEIVLRLWGLPVAQQLQRYGAASSVEDIQRRMFM